jgi:hypothetical protein
MPVSMFFLGSSAIGSMSALHSFCMKTRFQISMYLSSDPPGPFGTAGP